MTELRAGVYEHYKGGHYLLIGVARDDRDDSEDAEPLVIYARLYPRRGYPLTARPLSDFIATVETDGGQRPRFRHVGTTEDIA